MSLCKPKPLTMECLSDMRTIKLNRTPFLLAVTLALLASTTHADTLTGRVVSITDGDTLTLQLGRQHVTLRIAAIDAPDRFQAWGDRSRTNLSRLTINRTVTANCSRVERQGSPVCSVSVNGVDLGLQQIKDGMAWWDRKGANMQSAESQSAYAHAELMAKLRRTGLWNETNPVPPWEFSGGK